MNQFQVLDQLNSLLYDYRALKCKILSEKPTATLDERITFPSIRGHYQSFITILSKDLPTIDLQCTLNGNRNEPYRLQELELPAGHFKFTSLDYDFFPDIPSRALVLVHA